MTESPGPDFAAPSPEELAPFFPAYEIKGFIAQGGMGAVYAATQTSLDRPVAIKILPKEFSADPQFRANFEAEAKAMARLSHSNLIAVIDFGEANGMLFIIMEFVEGKSLHDSCRGEPIEPKEAGRLVSEICKGLAHAHKAGIIHRDIKPGNILLTPSAEPKIGDFGLARPLGEGGVGEDELIWGTPGYTAPEVVHNPNGVDQRTDIYAIGVLLHELLTGRIPDASPGAPSALAGFDPGFDAVYKRATHPDPAQRYPDAEAMARDIDAVVQRLENPASASPAGTRTTGPGRKFPTSKKKRVAPKLPVAPKTGGAPRPTTPKPATGAASRPLAASQPKPSSTPVVILIGAVVGVIALVALLEMRDKSRSPSSSDGSSSRSRSTDSTATPDRPKAKPKQDRDRDRDSKPGRDIADASRPDRPDRSDPNSEPASSTTTDPESEPGPVPDAPASTSLADVAEALGRGDFAQLPDGAIRLGTFVFLLIAEPATWHDALRQAEQFGAQLAVFDSPQAVTWASENLKASTPLWLGLSDSGTESQWHWVNGAPLDPQLWAPGQGGEGDRINFGALLPGSPVLDDLDEKRELPYVLQWVEGQAVPGSIAQQMIRLGQSFREQKPPVFPTGAVNIEGSRFLLVPGKVSWEVANTAAMASGGHLAVPSYQQEANWIALGLGKLLDDGSAAWIGGRFVGDQWKYTTGEMFYFVDWAGGEPTDPASSGSTCLALRRTVAGTAAMVASTGQEGDADCYLVEWSAPSRRNLPGPDGQRSAEEWLTEFRSTFLKTRTESGADGSEEIRENAEDWIRDVKRDTREFRQFSRATDGYLDSLEQEVERTGRVPNELPFGGGPFLGEAHRKALEKQREIEAKAGGQVDQAKQAYQTGIDTEVARRTQIGDRKGTAYLQADLDEAKADAYFDRILAGENPQPTPPPAPAPATLPTTPSDGTMPRTGTGTFFDVES